MADKPATEKTEQPTPRKLRKSREQGQVPQSQELGGAVTLVALLLALMVLGPGLFRWCQRQLEEGLSAKAITAFSDAEAFMTLVRTCVTDITIVLLPILAILSVAGIAANLAVGGYTFSADGIKLRWNAINPVNTIQTLFNKRSLVRLLLSILKLLFVGMIAWLYLRNSLEAMAALRWAWSTQIVAAIARLILGLGLRVGVAILILGVADALYQKWQHVQELRMTRQEVRQERKDTDGSPEVKARIRRIQVEMSVRRLKQDVPKASVILVNPTHVAVALRYDAKSMEAPVLLAKGADLLAERIVKIGRSYGIPIVQRPEVARAIYANVKPGQPIPEALYVAVAEVLAMIYRLRQKKRSQPGS